MPLLILLVACAPALRFPGPTAVVGRELPERAPWVDPVVPDLPTQAVIHRPDSGGGRWEHALVEAADHYLRHAPPSPFGDDCSGYVGAVLQRAGDVTLRGGTRALWARAEAVGATHHHKEPHVGDLVFFDQTYDADHDGRWNDPLTHVAIVVSVDDDGTITMAHGGTGAGRTHLVMNLRDPHREFDDAGKRINENLRRPHKGDPASAQYLASELWHGFATVRPDALDAWLAAR